MKRFLFLLVLSFLANRSQATVPETIVEISVNDLGSSIKKIKPKMGLDKNYAEKMARVIEGARKDLMQCLEFNTTNLLQINVNLVVEQSGLAQVKNENPEEKTSKELACLLQKLESIKYPEHTSEESVQVSLPVHLERKIP